ncbi:aldehyde dehydrogenase family protein [Bradyrhizobium sp. CNPSo 4026]|nr:aldehyde dehydrogenase family protein [Bradyrhizobium cenepequi]
MNATGYRLTFGLHSRLDETIAQVSNKIEAGNIYVNRNIIGAVVGIQPFGGSGLSGTGPKAGGPLYLGRLFARPRRKTFDGRPTMAARAYLEWLRTEGRSDEARSCEQHLSRSALGTEIELPGLVGERNIYLVRPRGVVAAVAQTERALLIQIGAILAAGNRAIVQTSNPARAVFDRLPGEPRDQIRLVKDWREIDTVDAILFDGSAQELIALNKEVAQRRGPIIPVLVRASAGDDYDMDMLTKEISISTNTAAAGGNASLTSIG